jgi:hypothetical protein
MQKNRVLMGAGILLLFIFISGCVGVQSYRNKYDSRPCVNPTSEFSQSCETHALQEFPTPDGTRYLLSFIEFDDQGQLLDRKQMESVVNILWDEFRGGKQDLLIVAFVHGWKHSAASNDDRDIKTFRRVLAQLADDEKQLSKKEGRPARKVAGVYLGWRGKSVDVPLVEELTFWSRKNAAERVGHAGVTELLGNLEQLKRTKDSMSDSIPAQQKSDKDDLSDSIPPPKKSATRLVIVGHSFGGAIVHSSLVQILENRLVRSVGPAGRVSDVEGFGDLVVLINPAFEALRFAQLSDMSMERTYFGSQLPVVAILTSEADWATRYTFPIGRNISTLFEHYPENPLKRKNAQTDREETIDEATANVTAVGHFEPYRTHELYPSGESSREVAVQSSAESVRSAESAHLAWKADKPGSKIPICWPYAGKN